MANGLLPNEGIADQLAYILTSEIMGVLPWKMILWKNDLEPDADTVLADLVECNFGGYFRVTLARNHWQPPTVDNGCATSIYGSAPIEWTVGSVSPQTIYGMAYVDFSSRLIRYVQRFDDGDIRTTEQGAQLSLWPQYTLTSAACESGRRTRSMRAAQRRKGIRP